jgi:hypothetical protein
MRAAFIFLIPVAASVTALAQSDPGSTTFKGPVVNPLPCRNHDLLVRHVNEEAAMGGLRLIDYAFKNKSSAVCTLAGFPRFELLDKARAVRPHGRAVNSQKLPTDEEARPTQRAEIEPGKEAVFHVYYNTGGAGYLGKPCPVTHKVRITAPGTTQRFVLRENISLCKGLQVSAVRSEEPQ